MGYFQQGTTVYQQNASGGYIPVASAPAGTYPNLPAAGYSAAPIAPTTTTTNNDQPNLSFSSGAMAQESYSDPRQSDQYKSKFSEILSGLEGDVDKYIGELTNIAQGDYDFTAKWIESNYKEALGTNDTARAEFFKSVANETEKKVGRIAYDYQTGTYRAEQDKTTALTRLKEDERVLTDKLTTQRMLDRETQNTGLNKRGLMEDGTRDTVGGLAQQNIGQLESDYAKDFEALARSVMEGEQDINTGFGRTIEDLTTTARRGGEDSQQQRDYGIEQAGNTLSSAKKNLDIQKYQLKTTLPSLAEPRTLRSLGWS
jgi:hypothetical protein